MVYLPWLVAAALAARLIAQLVLASWNTAAARRHRGAPPPAALEVMGAEKFERSIDYTLAKLRLGNVENVLDALVLAALVLTGALAAGWESWAARFGVSSFSGAGFFVVTMFALSLLSLPLDWWAQFRLEQKFGFNRSSQRLWLSDRLKGAFLGLLIGLPLLWLLFQLVQWIGPWWWLVAWGVVMAFQLVMMVLFPMLIWPWFNKLTPLPEGDLRARLMELANRAGFRASTIQVVDGSRRSAHSNALFTGFGRFRRIVLFDTLIEQLAPAELEAVLAHEIGHYKLGHIPRGIALSAAISFGIFALLGWLIEQPAFFAAFGVQTPHVSIGLLIVTLYGSAFTYWAAPLGNALSRRHEYQADNFARQIVAGPEPMIHALRKLSRENLSNLTPHPVYSAFYYSHPTLVEREAALRKAGAAAT